MQSEITKRPLTTVVTTSCWSTTNPTHQILQTRVTKPTTVGGPRLANCHNAPSQANAPNLPGTLDPHKARTPKGTNARIANRTSARNPTKTPRMGRTSHCQAMGPNLVNRIQSMMTAQTHKTTRVTTTTEGGKEKDARRRETSCGSTHPGMMQLRPTSVKDFWTSCHYTFQKDTPCARS